MTQFNRALNWKIMLAIVWMILTLSLAIWWLMLALGLVNQIELLSLEISDKLSRTRTMLVWEGITWMVLLLLGGGSIVYSLVQVERRSHQIREFFAAFSHDVKTSITSLRLQAESLKEDIQEASSQILLSRLISDTVRLQLQLENSLFLSNKESKNLFMEEVDLDLVIKNLHHQWPKLNIDLKSNCKIICDRQALESVIKNIVQNSVIHGSASHIEIQCFSEKNGQIKLSFKDNGSGFNGEVKRLGEPFHRHNPQSGSGIGLFICKTLLEKMNGSFEVVSVDKGFQSDIFLKGHMI